MKTVIMAGGKGTRISSLVNNIPKPMIKIGNKPILEYEIDSLRNQGFKDIILTIGHLGNSIINYFGNGSKVSPVTNIDFGVHIEYFVEEEPLGNAGALLRMKKQLTDDFLLLNADVIFNVDFKRFVSFHKKHGGLVTLFTHPNSHPYDSGLIIANEQNMVEKWLSKEEDRPVYYQNRVNAGLHIINPTILKEITPTAQVDLDRHLLKPLAGTGKMFCYDSPEYVKDMGTPERYYSVSNDFNLGIVNQKNLKKMQKAIFLDRDGTVNKHVGFLKNIDDFELIDGVAEAIKTLNRIGYLVIIVTNQPVVARGEITEKELKKIHNKMETLLGMQGAYLDAIYYCPHHPDKGYKGERKELKIKCKCRKPNPGMLLEAAKHFNIDLKCSWMVGDSANDIKAGQYAGCKTALIGKGNFGQKLTADSLLNFIKLLQVSD
ncbi:MAG: D-glycero-beta-D-manno-heptose 1,7-bisphosphate 7-phosphatase [Lachnospiraceae bacterium]|nr:D-glycero-beta-D-manno-heptose 1,7-bisphosphate 7-phosphatase [Lachnospiraceae bacterium]